MNKIFFIFVFFLIFVISVAFFVFTKDRFSVPSQFTSSEHVEQTPEPQPFRILFGGDMMFDRNVRTSMERNGVNHVLSPVQETLLSYDMVVANLEGPITPFPSKSVGSAIGSPRNFTFTFDPSIVPMLKEHNIQIVSLANNHIQNFGPEGVISSKQYLQEGEIHYFGYTGEEESSVERVYFLEKNGKKFAFVGVNQFVSQGFETGEEDVKFARENADIVIVMPHWGNEYEPHSGLVIEGHAHRLVDAGADLIIGSHPHVIQQKEEYKGKTIYYSLGNFVFDQYFEEAVRKGMLVGVEFQPDGKMTFTEISTYLKGDGQTVFR